MYLFFKIILFSYTPLIVNDITVNVPDNIVLCEPDCLTLDGEIYGAYSCLEWTSDLGYYNDSELSPYVCVDEEENFILTAYSNESGPNLIFNGDFESGNTGFTTEYGYLPCGANPWGVLGCEGSYTIDTDASLTHANFSPCLAQSVSQYMIINGAASLSQIWCQTLSVNPYSKYYFSAWATSVHSSSPAQLQFSINGIQLSNILNLSTTTCIWEELTDVWSSNTTSNVELCVTNLNTAVSGNDFGIDNIFFAELCKDTAHLQVKVEEFFIYFDEPQEINCNQLSTELEIFTDPIDKPYTYQWFEHDGGNIVGYDDQASITVDAPGIYEVIVTDINNCTQNEFITVFGNLDLPIVHPTTPNILNCLMDYSIISLFPESLNYIYSWAGPEQIPLQGDEIIVSTPGLYSVTFTDGNSFCEDSINIEVFIDTLSTPIQILSSNPLNCNTPFTNLTIEIQQAYQSIEWTTPEGTIFNNESLTVHLEGYYEVNLVYQNGCEVNSFFDLTRHQPEFNYSILGDSILDCNVDLPNLALQLQTENISFEWTFPNDTVSNDSLIVIDGGGWHMLELKDEFGCSRVDSIFVKEDFDLPLYSLKGDTLTCQKTRGVLTVDSLDLFTDFFWLTPNGDSLFTKEPEVDVQGIYTIEIKGSNGCIVKDSVSLEISENIPRLSIVGEDVLNCNSTELILTGSANINLLEEYWLSPMDDTIAGNVLIAQSEGIYRYIGITQEGCRSEEVHQISIDTLPPLINFNNGIPIDCNNPSFYASLNSIDSLSSIRWLSETNSLISSTTEFITTIPGNYELIVTSINGCEARHEFQVHENLMEPTFEVTSNVIDCNEPQTWIDVESDMVLDYYIILNNDTLSYNQPLLTNQAENYMILAIGENGCQHMEYHEVLIDSIVPVVHIEFLSALNCADQYLFPEITTEDLLTSYLWTNPNSTVSNTFMPDSSFFSYPGNYQLETQSENGCKEVFNALLDIDTSTTPFLIEIDTLSCIKDTVHISLLNHLDYMSIQWFDQNGEALDNNQLQITQAGSYELIAFESNGCQSHESVEIIDISNDLSLELNSEHNILDCYNHESHLYLDTDNQYNEIIWHLNDQEINLSQDFIIDEAGTYSVTITDDQGCKTEDSLYIEVDTITPSLIIETTDINCINTEALIQIINPSDDLDYGFYVDQSLVSNTDILEWPYADDIYIEAIGQNGCISTVHYEISVDTITFPVKLTGGELTCRDTLVLIEQNDLYQAASYNWSSFGESLSNEASILVDQPSWYVLEIINQNNGCISVDSIEIRENSDLPTAIDFTLPTLMCNDSEVALEDVTITGGVGEYLYSINNGPYVSHDQLSNIYLGENHLSIKDENECLLDTSFTVFAPQGVESFIEPELELEWNNDHQLELMINKDIEEIFSIKWSPSLGLSCDDCVNPIVNLLEDQLYDIQVVDVNGCTSGTSILIRIAKDLSIYAPNVFTPFNNDGNNDVFRFFAKEDNIEWVNNFSIFDRWGNLMFTQKNIKYTDPDFGWKGYCNNKKVQPGVYVYKAELQFINGDKIGLLGDLTLLE